MRHRLTSAIVIAAAAIGGLAAPGMARAGSPAACPEGISTTREGAVLVKGTVDSPDSAVVHLRDKKTGLRVASIDKWKVVPVSVDPAGDPHHRQRVSEPVKLPDLGIYTIEVGGEAEPTVCGGFDYRLRSEVAHAATQGTVSLDQLTTNVSADLTTFDPRTRTSSPLKNTKVTLSTDRTSQEVTTDAQGHLASPFTFRGTEASTDVRVGVRATPEMDPEEGHATAVAVRQRAEILLDSQSERIWAHYGSIAKLTGRALRIAPDGTRKPVPEGTPLLDGANGATTTGADGRFERQVRILREDESTTWVNGESYPWLESTQAGTDVELVAVTSFQGVGATIDAARRVTFTGSLDRKPGVAGQSAEVEIQYSADGRTNWTTRKVFTAGFDSDPFHQTVPGETNGYWRLRYAGEALVLGTAGEPLRLSRTVTAFKTFDAAPEPLRKGQGFAIKGKLQHGTPAKAYGGQTVLFYFRPAGTEAFTYKGRAKTAKDGTFVRKFTADTTGTWIARHRDADGSHFAAESRQDELPVN